MAPIRAWRAAASSSAISTMLKAIESSCMPDSDDAPAPLPSDLYGFARLDEHRHHPLSSRGEIHARARFRVALHVEFDEVAAAQLQPFAHLSREGAGSGPV